MKEFQDNNNQIYNIKQAPPVIDDNGFCFFKDANGVEYSVEMRGVRTKDGIFFKAKDLQGLFEMPNLCRNIVDNITTHVEHIDYQFFIFENTHTRFNMKDLLFISMNQSIG